ncbi:MAG: hypothetical protein O3C61_07420 [Proteobacteria bacterium]|nr:hypothetical protein [Pseudomonadota bacterium]
MSFFTIFFIGWCVTYYPMIILTNKKPEYSWLIFVWFFALMIVAAVSSLQYIF